MLFIYANLQEVGIRLDVKSRARVDLASLLKKEGHTRVSISEKTGLGVCTVQAAIAGKNVTMHSADKIAEALGRSRLDLFIDVEKRKTLDANTVRGYHRLISSILTKAVKWGFIPFNPAAKAELPKLTPKEAAHLDEEDARRLLELLQNEPAKYRAAISFDLLSGLRRSELLGLRWSDIDFENETVTIVQTSSYIPGVGIYTDTPKNKTSARPLKLSRSAFFVLRQVQEWQEEQRALCGDRKIQSRSVGNYMRNKVPTLAAKAFYGLEYDKMRKTDHFRVESSCIGCGLCARNCPVQAIEMQDKHPVWVKEQCVMCLSCLHHCPKFAIQHENRTKKHRQYTNPNVS